MTRHVMAGDVGGTKTRLAVFEVDHRSPRPARLIDRTYASADFPDFRLLLADFTSELPMPIEVACIGVAGPVIDGSCQTTNLPWTLESQRLASEFSLPTVLLLNDLEATAYGLLELPDSGWVELNPAAQRSTGNIAVLAAGTGLGQAILAWDGKRHRVIATEGGHADFAPNSALQDRLLQNLREIYGGHVSVERVISGPGIHQIYRFIQANSAWPEPPALAKALHDNTDPARLISEFGLLENDPLCREVLGLFARLYGAEAGNCALKSFARGGVMLGGGIAPKILPILREGGFLEAFCAKGRFSDWMKTLSVRVSLNPDAALFGAACVAARHCTTSSVSVSPVN